MTNYGVYNVAPVRPLLAERYFNVVEKADKTGNGDGASFDELTQHEQKLSKSLSGLRGLGNWMLGRRGQLKEEREATNNMLDYFNRTASSGDTNLNTISIQDVGAVASKDGNPRHLGGKDLGGWLTPSAQDMAAATEYSASLQKPVSLTYEKAPVRSLSTERYFKAVENADKIGNGDGATYEELALHEQDLSKRLSGLRGVGNWMLGRSDQLKEEREATKNMVNHFHRTASAGDNNLNTISVMDVGAIASKDGNLRELGSVDLGGWVATPIQQ